MHSAYAWLSINRPGLPAPNCSSVRQLFGAERRGIPAMTDTPNSPNSFHRDFSICVRAHVRRSYICSTVRHISKREREREKDMPASLFGVGQAGGASKVCKGERLPTAPSLIRRFFTSNAVFQRGWCFTDRRARAAAALVANLTPRAAGALPVAAMGALAGDATPGERRAPGALSRSINFLGVRS